ncbi:MAG: hypothetical protein IJR14_03785, partial [Synergistaceae bacterium]|nr:hypothetical protein [Synergistaceae bacterium]
RELLSESLKGADEAWAVWRAGIVESETADAQPLGWRGRRRWTGGRTWRGRHDWAGWSVSWTELSALPLRAVDGAANVHRGGAVELEAVERPPLTWRALASWAGHRHWKARHEGLGGQWSISWTEED